MKDEDEILICEICCKEESPTVRIRKDKKHTLCDKCMEEAGLVYDYDDYEFIPTEIDCDICGETMEWCSCCKMYSCGPDCNGCLCY